MDKETHPGPPFPPSSTSVFLPVQITAASSKFALEMPATDGEELLSKAEGAGPLSSPAKVSASLPNGVRLNALAAIIGALVMFKLGADLQVYLASRADRLSGRHQQSCGPGSGDEGTRSICACGFCVLQSPSPARFIMHPSVRVRAI